MKAQRSTRFPNHHARKPKKKKIHPLTKAPVTLAIAEAHRHVRLRAALLREQVRHEGAASAPEPAQARRVRQTPDGLSLLQQGVRLRHPVGPSRQVRPLPRRLSPPLRDRRSAARGSRGPPQGPLHHPPALVQLQGGRLSIQGETRATFISLFRGDYIL